MIGYISVRHSRPTSPGRPFRQEEESRACRVVKKPGYVIEMGVNKTWARFAKVSRGKWVVVKEERSKVKNGQKSKQTIPGQAIVGHRRRTGDITYHPVHCVHCSCRMLMVICIGST